MPKADIINKIIEAKGGSIDNLEKKLGYSQAGLSKAIKKKSDLKTEKLEILLELYPDLNPLWLCLGRGEMFVDENNFRDNQGENRNSDDSMVNTLLALAEEYKKLKKERESMMNVLNRTSLELQSNHLYLLELLQVVLPMLIAGKMDIDWQSEWGIAVSKVNRGIIQNAHKLEKDRTRTDEDSRST